MEIPKKTENPYMESAVKKTVVVPEVINEAVPVVKSEVAKKEVIVTEKKEETPVLREAVVTTSSIPAEAMARMNQKKAPKAKVIKEAVVKVSKKKLPLNAVQEDAVPEIEEAVEDKLDYEKVFRKYIQRHGKNKSNAKSLTDLWAEANEGVKNRRSIPVVLAILDEGEYNDYRSKERKALIAGLEKATNILQLHSLLYRNYSEEQNLTLLNDLIRNNG